jgi:hypothetical protein
MRKSDGVEVRYSCLPKVVFSPAVRFLGVSFLFRACGGWATALFGLIRFCVDLRIS